MSRRNKTKILPFMIASLTGIIAAYALFLRKRLLRWGAPEAEAPQPFPGDGLVPAPNYETTRAVLVRAAPEDIWPWIVQIGYRRGGFYSYDWLERMAGLKDLHSSGRVNPDWQGLQPNDSVSISPVTPLKVAVLEPGRALVLHAAMDPFTAEIVDPALRPGGPYIDWSWAFVLEPAGPGAARLIARVRANFQPQLLGKILSWLAIEPVHFLMERKMLQGIQVRAEATRSSPLLLDDFLPQYDFTEVHRIRIHAPPGQVYQAVKELRAEELSPLIFAMLDFRNLPAVLAGRDPSQTHLPQQKTFLEQLYAGGFIPLADDADCRELVFGSIGQFWKLTGGEEVQVAGPEAFRAFRQTGFARVAANLVVQELGEESLLSTETRIWAPDAETRRKFAAYWQLISLGSGWIRVLWLKSIKRKAEAENPAYQAARPPKTIYHRMKSLNARMAANYQRGFGPRQAVLLLTTTGRKSGLPRVTPLQFEEVDGEIYIASARGPQADWFKNILANPRVRVKMGDRAFEAIAEPLTDPARIADFLELRLRRHPVMVRLIMHLFDGLPLRFTHADLEVLSKDKAMVILHP